MMEAAAASGMTRYADTSTVMDEADPEDEEDDEYAPPLPPPPVQKPPGESSHGTAAQRPGPAVPTVSDLEVRRTLESEAREAELSSLRLSRRADRATQKERLDELLPRPEPATRERQLEKRRLTTEAMREFASAREPGAEMEVAEGELLGGGADDEYRRMLESSRQRKTEREVRREEVARARNAERDERIRGARAREEERLAVLREMARQRFG